MDFALSPEQEALGRTLRAFAQRELSPRSRQWDRDGVFPWDAWRRMGELGLLGFRHPPEFGGEPIDLVSAGIAMEEVGRGDLSCTYGIQVAGLAGQFLGQHGSDELKARWLPPTARGDAIVALALTEPGAGSDAASLACRAERRGQDYAITGEKSGISLGMAAQAAIVFARTGEEPRARGITAFLIPLDLPGVSKSALRDSGTRAIGRAVLSFDGVEIPASHRIGPEGAGFRLVMEGFDYNRVLVSLACLGAAQVSLEETMAYVRQRVTFGRPLVAFEGVSFPIAEIATRLDAARWFCYRALWMADRGLRHTKEAAMIKWWVPRLSVEAIHECLLLHGHYGYTEELPFEQRMRDVMGLEIGDGSAQIMKIVVARELMGRESLPY